MACTGATTQELPSPDERPDADVVIYDGRCGICMAQVKKLPWWDCQGKLSYLSLHDPRVTERFPDLTHEELMREMVIVDRHGRRHRGAYALRYLTRRLRRLWWLAPLLCFPGAMLLWKPLYRHVAQGRYRLSRKTACNGGGCERHR